MIDISVVIPVYNVEKYVTECVESVLANEQVEIEILCINDGSTDSSLEVIKELAAKYDCIKVVSQENRGLSATRNKGICMASGKYVYFLDSDDRIGKGALKNLYDYMEADDLDVLYFGGEAFYETEKLEKQFPDFTSSYHRTGVYKGVSKGLELLRKLREQKDFSPHACIQILRRKFLLEHNISFYEGILHEDNLFSFQVFMNAKRAKCVNDVYFYRRVRESSIMTTGVTYKNLLGYFITFREMQNYLYGMELKSEEENTVNVTLLSMKYHVRRCYNLINDKEREKFYGQLDSGARLFFKNCLQQEIEMENKNREMNSRNREMVNRNNEINRELGEFRSSVFRIKDYITARIDFKLFDVENPGLEVISVSDSRAEITMPGWLQEDGVGYKIESYMGSIDITMRSSTGGTLRIWERGRDVRNEEGKRIPYWIEYQNVQYNGNIIPKEQGLVWHDKPICTDYLVEAGEEIHFHVEWMPYRGDYKNLEVIEKQGNQIKSLLKEIDDIKESYSFRIGNKITYVPRKIKNWHKD